MTEDHYTENQQITSIGLKYVGHFNICEFSVTFDTCGTDIPIKRIGEFVKLFDVDMEDGYMLHKLKGSYVRVTFDWNTRRLVMIQHITKDKNYILDVKK